MCGSLCALTVLVIVLAAAEGLGAVDLTAHLTLKACELAFAAATGVGTETTVALLEQEVEGAANRPEQWHELPLVDRILASLSVSNHEVWEERFLGRNNIALQPCGLGKLRES